jgi:predicted phosphoribosyltransferase
MKKIRFYDDCECKMIMIDIEEVKKHYNEFKGVDYEDIEEYMAIHAISEKHKKEIQGSEHEKH